MTFKQMRDELDDWSMDIERETIDKCEKIVRDEFIKLDLDKLWKKFKKSSATAPFPAKDGDWEKAFAKFVIDYYRKGITGNKK